MKITGIIAEYNPFHAGHAYQIAEARRRSDADAICVILSPSWVQRGEPAVFRRSARVEMALAGGADIVLEMPAPFAAAAAPDFAFWGTSVLTGIGCDALSFGCEDDDAALLQTAARILAEEPEPFGTLLREGLKKGLSYPAAREAAFSGYLTGAGPADSSLSGHCRADLLITEESIKTACGARCSERLHRLLSESNNILALEYCASLARQKQAPEIIPVRRVGASYNETGLPALSGNDSSPAPDSAAPFVSAMAIRNHLKEDAAAPADELRPFVPKNVFSLMEKETPLFPEDFSDLLQYAILRSDRDSLLSISDVGNDIAGRILGTASDFRSFRDWIDLLKVRQFTYTRISRALTHILLGIRTDEIMNWKGNPDARYARILGFRREASPVLRELKKRTSIPMITRPADCFRTLSPAARSLFEKNAACEHIYQTVLASKNRAARKTGARFENEYRSGPVIYPSAGEKASDGAAS